ncbi:MAG: hypothetical protein HQ530_01415 [Parcubacteria group bacterium]|nr:hypothetical protein [Parcubacteria group bacterium]
MIKKEQFKSFSAYLLACEADRRGIRTKKILEKGIFKQESYLELSYRNHQEIIIGQRISQTSVIAHIIQENKELTKYFLDQAGINTAQGEVFEIDNLEEILRFSRKVEFPIVAKPLSATHGQCVFIGIDSENKITEAVAQIKKEGFEEVLLEEEFEGTEYRIFATRNKFLAATLRIPANVVGNGIDSISKLIEEKNKDPRREVDHSKSLVNIEVDSTVKDYLKSQDLSLEFVPPEDKQVFLRPNSNLSTGGDSIDMTDKIHPGVKELAVKVIQSIPDLAYAGIDYLTKDINQAPDSDNYIVIEVNGSPMLSMHHVPFEGKTRNVAKAIIDMLFPETKEKH